VIHLYIVQYKTLYGKQNVTEIDAACIKSQLLFKGERRIRTFIVCTALRYYWRLSIRKFERRRFSFRECFLIYDTIFPRFSLATTQQHQNVASRQSGESWDARGGERVPPGIFVPFFARNLYDKDETNLWDLRRHEFGTWDLRSM